VWQEQLWLVTTVYVFLYTQVLTNYLIDAGISRIRIKYYDFCVCFAETRWLINTISRRSFKTRDRCDKIYKINLLFAHTNAQQHSWSRDQRESETKYWVLPFDDTSRHKCRSVFVTLWMSRKIERLCHQMESTRY